MKLMPLSVCASTGIVLATLLSACTQHKHEPVAAASHVKPVASESGEHKASAFAPGLDEAVHRLKEGNARFVRGESQHPHEARTWRAGLESAQHPFATVIGCSDSRVPLELLFDQGFGDLFVIRVAGNLVARDEAGTVEYAVVHLHTPIVAVIGHEKCGAVTAALGSHEQITREPPELRDLLAAIHVGIPEMPTSLPLDQRIAKGVEANVRNAMDQLLMTPSVRNAVDSGQAGIVGGIYNLHSGEVRWLEPHDRKGVSSGY
ncbi:MAG: carbonic anhydrase [Planctomycetota bacterium]|jgi:carbonic anhydrase